MATSIFKNNFPGAEKLQQAVDAADYIIGLDLHKKTTAICVVDRRKPDAPACERKQLKNNQLPEMLLRFAGKKVIACEAAYGWHLLRSALLIMPDTTFVPLDARKTASWIKTSGINKRSTCQEQMQNVHSKRDGSTTATNAGEATRSYQSCLSKNFEHDRSGRPHLGSRMPEAMGSGSSWGIAR